MSKKTGRKEAALQSAVVKPTVIAGQPRLTPLLAVVILAIATFAVYANSFAGVFQFDDDRSILSNPTIRDLGNIGMVFSPPSGQTVGGRPLLNLTLAINYALSGSAIWSYHLVNILLHLGTGLLLFGILRRTFALLPAIAADPAGNEQRDRVTGLAFLATLLWLVHPLQTESVTYVVQRAESLVSLFFLATLYAAIRSASAERPIKWYFVSVIACCAGMASKEVMVGAPLVVLLYDRAFLAGSFRLAWQRRRGLYLALAATWLVLGATLLMHGRGITAGLGLGLSVTDWSALQFEAVTRYIGLAFWPHPQVLDYGPTSVWSVSHSIWYAIVVVPLVAAITVAFWRRSAIGAAGLFALIALAPTSSLMPNINQVMAEHRMYLGLASLIVVVVCLLNRVLGRWVYPVCAVWACCLAWRTVGRNRDYHSELAMWTTVVAQVPTNARAQQNLGRTLSMAGDQNGALEHYQAAVRLEPTNATMQNDYGLTLVKLNRLPESIERFRAAVMISPGYHEARLSLGMMLTATGHLEEGLAEFRTLQGADPNYPGLQLGLSEALRRIRARDQKPEQ